MYLRAGLVSILELGVILRRKAISGEGSGGGGFWGEGALPYMVYVKVAEHTAEKSTQGKNASIT